MKRALTLAVTLGLILAPAAYAQATCSEIVRINSEALEDFDAIAGEEIEGDLYEASVWLSGAGDCNIDYEFDSIYSCLYQFESYDSAAAALNANLAAVGSCLAGWTSSSVTPDSEAKEGYRTLSGTLHAGTGDYEDMEWAVILEEHTGTHGTDYHVWVQLAYYWF